MVDDRVPRSAVNYLGLAYGATGRLPGAIAPLGRVRDVSMAGLGPDRVNTLDVLSSLAVLDEQAR
ncbi:hypothetical protein [Aquisphaera giovannonii]|nr:hypothetical protein [Aquisphaera giovannonii]